MNESWEENYSAIDFYAKYGGRQCVYGWFRDGECLYIEFSTNGISRILGHDKINRVEPLLESDEIRFIWNPEDALLLESILIEKYDPKYNSNAGHKPVPSNRPLLKRTCPKCFRTYQQKTWWQKVCSNRCPGPTRKHKTRTIITPKLTRQEILAQL